MLVKVRNDDPSRLSSTERTVVNWLKSWSGPHAVPGIAVVQCQDADVVVWTPQTCVVVGVHGFTERVNGTLTCAQDEPWMVDGEPAPMDGDANPLERVRQQTVDLAHQLRAAPGREQVPVSGLVLLVPQLGSRVRLEKGALPPGIDVLIGDGPSSLRAYFKTLSEGAEPSWDAAQVGQSLGALGFAAAASYSDLIAEGFPPPESARSAPPPMSVAPTVVVPSVPVQSPGPSDTTETAGSSAPTGERDAESGRAASGPGVAGQGGVSVTGAPEADSGSRSGAAGSDRPTRDQPAARQGSPGSGRPSAAGAAVAGAGAAAAAAAAYRAVTGTAEPQQGSAAGAPPAPAPETGRRSGLFGGRTPESSDTESSGRGGWLGGRPSSPVAGPESGGRTGMFGGRSSAPAPGPESGGRTGFFGGRPSSPAAGPQAGAYANPAAGQPQPGAPGFPVWPDQRPGVRPARRRRPDLMILAGLVLLALVLALAVTCVGGGSSVDERQPDPRPGTSVRQIAPTATTDPTIPRTTIPPACFPLQPC
ncbi:hypothetical protein [Nocardia huaxiensis]|uniref:NERD domain-containing protein n=1 Tax=Nocardia huaxiensis TaxID=2755382 RepID=A0A7D6V6T9_9NOCA|nr:hypothetical protein [Nocardia huaxiensis]QLY28961.1 hypothetical protein H0264_27070 [Nocardia huaxiensis]UFS97559.1 hypothetical protein LPY97_06530 [Nocardia huaxiensis]